LLVRSLRTIATIPSFLNSHVFPDLRAVDDAVRILSTALISTTTVSSIDSCPQHSLFKPSVNNMSQSIFFISEYNLHKSDISGYGKRIFCSDCFRQVPGRWHYFASFSNMRMRGTSLYYGQGTPKTTSSIRGLKLCCCRPLPGLPAL